MLAPAALKGFEVAEIVLGIGSSHGPMLVTEVEDWKLRLAADQADLHPWRGRDWTYDELVSAREAENIALKCEPWEQERALRKCRYAIDLLADDIRAADVDVAVIVGNDQMELFDARSIPALSIYCGSVITNHDLPPERLAQLPVGIEVSVPGYIPKGGADYGGLPDLGLALAGHFVDQGFDPLVMRELPKPETPHAFGFVYRHLMRDDPVPSLPVLINTFYSPNQPTAPRCVAMGDVIFDAIRKWDADKRVAVIASGGLTHFVIDEDFDREFLDALTGSDIAGFAAAHGEGVFQSGTSEMKNWLPVARVMELAGFKANVVDYVPCYRSAAGTGNAMAFVTWSPEQ